MGAFPEDILQMPIILSVYVITRYVYLVIRYQCLGECMVLIYNKNSDKENFT